MTPRVCYSRPKNEEPKTDSFVEVDEITLDRKIRRIFTGWMFAESPGLNAVEHAVYDVWLKGCKQKSDVPPPDAANAEAPKVDTSKPKPAAAAAARTARRDGAGRRPRPTEPPEPSGHHALAHERPRIYAHGGFPMSDSKRITAIKKDLLALEKKFWTGDAAIYRDNADTDCLVAFTDMSGDEQQGTGRDREQAQPLEDLEIDLKGIVEPADDIAMLTYEANAVRDNGEALRGAGQHRLCQARRWLEDDVPLADAAGSQRRAEPLARRGGSAELGLGQG